MRAFAQRQHQPQKSVSSCFAKSHTATTGLHHHVDVIRHLQNIPENQTTRQKLQADDRDLDTRLTNTVSPRFAHDFSRLPVHPAATGPIQMKSTINKPGDQYEQEADRVANKLMGMLAPQQDHACACGAQCPGCQARQQSSPAPVIQKISAKDVGAEEVNASASAHDVLRSPGHPLDQATKDFFEPRFGHDFSKVRVHTDDRAAASARSINAVAYTRGHDIVFGNGKLPGRNFVTAHELTHVLQQTNNNGRPSNNIQRMDLGPTVGLQLNVAGLQRDVACLSSLEDEMKDQTNQYLTTACSKGDHSTSKSGVEYIPEDRADAFGHCWIACQGAKKCGQEPTRKLGTMREYLAEGASYLGLVSHNSFHEDLFNEKYGRELAKAKPPGDCSSLCYQAVVNNSLRFHGQHTGRGWHRRKVYNCSGITLDKEKYPQGWSDMPEWHLKGQ